MVCQTLVTGEINLSFREDAGAYDRYEEFVSENLCKLSYRIDRERNFRISSTTYSLDDFMIGRFTTASGKGDLIRTRSGINEDSRERVGLYIPVRGDLELLQFSRTECCRPGSMALISTEEPFIQRKLGDNDTVYFFMPHAFVDQRLASSENLYARILPINTGMRRLVHDSVLSLQRDASAMTDMEFRSAARLLGELVILALNSSTDHLSDERSVRTSNLVRAKRIIRARLGDPDLTIAEVAKQCGISLRYLHEIFRAEGVTASEYIKSQRLQRARQMLESGDRNMTVTDVCFSCGFSNTSQFSTAFRHAFAMSPRDVLRGSRYCVTVPDRKAV